MYDWFNLSRWDKCFTLIDPRLSRQKVQLSVYADQLGAFKQAYGQIKPWHIRISLHHVASSNKQDERPFAYVYVVWQAEANAFHMFRERWVKESDQWFTRVAGLVPSRQALVGA